MKKKLIDGKTIDTECIGCSLVKKELIPYGGIIFESKYFLVNPDPEIPIPGFLILTFKRHVPSILDFTDQEFDDFNKIFKKTRQAIKKVFPNSPVTIIQKEIRPHFHLWFLPKLKWMENYGDKLEDISKILEYSRDKLKTKDNLKKIVSVNGKIKKYMNQH